jgi:hypothetical protein
MGPNRNPRWEQKRTEGYVIVSRLLAHAKKASYAPGDYNLEFPKLFLNAIRINTVPNLSSENLKCRCLFCTFLDVNSLNAAGNDIKDWFNGNFILTKLPQSCFVFVFFSF